MRPCQLDGQLYKDKLNHLLHEETGMDANVDAKLAAVEKTMVDAGACAQSETLRDENGGNSTERERLRRLIHERRLLKEDWGLTTAIKMKKQKDLSKEIQKLMRKHLRALRVNKISSILSKFRGLRDIAWIKGTSSRQGIEALKDTRGITITDKKGISNVFATFSEDLYRRQSQVDVEPPTAPILAAFEEPTAEFSMEEFQAAVKTMKRHKAGDDAGVVAEIIKDDSPLLQQTILERFYEVLMLKDAAPSSWKSLRLCVIYKKGDRDLPKNHRPIALLSILYKLFSQMLCNRLAKILLPQ